MCVCLRVCLFVRVVVILFVLVWFCLVTSGLFFCASVCLCVCLLWLVVSVFGCLFVCLFGRASVCVFVCLLVSLVVLLWFGLCDCVVCVFGCVV